MYMMWACILLYILGVIYEVKKKRSVIRGDRVRRSVRPCVCNPLSVTKLLNFCDASYRSSLQKLLSRLGFYENGYSDNLALLTGVN
jgi:hypothetical protein